MPPTMLLRAAWAKATELQLYPLLPAHGQDTQLTKCKEKEIKDDYTSVSDPDPYVFGPPRSGSVCQRYRSGSLHHQTKIVRKTLIPTVF
jgi:hypothetical protein